MTAVVREVLARATDALRDGGSASPRLDAEVLLAHVLGRDRSWLHAHPEEDVEPAVFDALVARRVRGEPIAYLRGFKEWRSLRIRTDARALVPRPETELLLDQAIAEIGRRMAQDREPIVAWEVATGTGAVAVALALRYREAIALGRLRLIASDLSRDALELATENLEGHGVASLVDLACADLLEPAGVTLPRPDVVVANLPYVPSEEVRAPGRGLDHEPLIALDGGTDGLVVFRRLFAMVPDRVAPAATLLLEIGAGQADDLRALAGPVASVAVERDLAGMERVVRVSVAGTGA